MFTNTSALTRQIFAPFTGHSRAGFGRVLQEAQLMLTTGSTRLAVSRGQQSLFNMVPFHMLHIV